VGGVGNFGLERRNLHYRAAAGINF